MDKDQINLKRLNKFNAELFINNIKYEFKKFFITDKEGKYNIKLKLNKNITDSSYMFSGCENIISINFNNFSTKKITNMKGMFLNCNNLKDINLFAFSTKNVTDMSYMFYGCEMINSLDLSSFDFKNVKNIDNMLSNCEQLNNILISFVDKENDDKINNMIKVKNNLNKFEIIKFNHYDYDYDYLFKFIIFCNIDLGKQKLLQAAALETSNSFDDKLIFGYDFTSFSVKYENKFIKVQIWHSDIAVKNISFYRGSNLAIFVYSINDIDSFNSIESLVKTCFKYGNKKLKFFLVANKIDIPEKE